LSVRAAFTALIILAATALPQAILASASANIRPSGLVPQPPGGTVFQLHDDGSIWRSTGVPCSGGSCPGWVELDNNPAAAAITAGDGTVFQLHDDGSIWRSTGVPCSGGSCPGWTELDNNPAAVQITVSNGS
jgi:hypothetical protein